MKLTDRTGPRILVLGSHFCGKSNINILKQIHYAKHL